VWLGRWTGKGGPCEKIDLRVNSKSNNKPHIQSIANDEWYFHQDKRIDICAAPMTPAPPSDHEGNDTDVMFLTLPAMALVGDRLQTPGIENGDEVFIPSAFIGRVGEKKNIAIIRTAHVYALPEEPISFGSPRLEAYLIETKSLGGTSGAPIFLNMLPSHVKHPKNPPKTSTSVDVFNGTKYTMHMPYLLVGMVLGGHSGQYLADFLPDADTDILPPKDVDFNAGISVAMTAGDIMDFIRDDPTLSAKREAEIKSLGRDSGYRPSSAGGPPPKVENRSHPPKPGGEPGEKLKRSAARGLGLGPAAARWRRAWAELGEGGRLGLGGHGRGSAPVMIDRSGAAVRNGDATIRACRQAWGSACSGRATATSSAARLSRRRQAACRA
jgi:hypothetical protein